MKKIILTACFLVEMFSIDAMSRIRQDYDPSKQTQAAMLLREKNIEFNNIYDLIKKLKKGISRDKDFLSVYSELNKYKQSLELFLSDDTLNFVTNDVNAELFDDALACESAVAEMLNDTKIQERINKLKTKAAKDG